MITIVVGRAVQFILLLVMMRVATTVLSPEEMGRLSLVTAATAFYALFLVNPVGMFINRRLHAWNALGQAKYYLKLHWIYLAGVSAVAGASLAVLNLVHVYGFQFNTAWLLVLVCGSLVFNTINQTSIPSLNLLEFRGWFVILTLATIAAGLLSSCLLVSTFSATAENWLLGLLTGQAIFAVVGVKLLFNRLKPAGTISQPTQEHLGRLFNFVWPVAISVGFNWLQTQGYRFLVADTLGFAAFGLFVAGYGISAGLLAAFESVLTTYFQPRFYKLVNNNDQAKQSLAWQKYAATMLPSLILVTFLLAGLAPELTRFMVGPAYQSASQFVVWGVIAEGARVVVGVYSMSAHANMKTRLLILPNLLGAAICITLVLLLAPSMGAHGAGLALAVAGSGVLVSMHYRMIIPLKMRLPFDLMLKGIFMGTALIALTVFGRWVMGGAVSFTTAGALIVLVGAAFLPMLYWLLYPYLPRHDKTS